MCCIGNSDLLLAEGQFSRAFLIDDGRRVARYPRHEFGRAKLRREAELLNVIAAALPVPVSVAVEFREDCVVHDLLPGEALTEARMRAMNAVTRRSVVGRVRDFLDALHAIDPVLVPPSVPRFDGDAFAQHVRSRCETELYPRMTDAARRRADAELHALLAISGRPSVLCHADIGGNVIYDDATGTLGVIDFGEAMVADPVYDAASVSCLGAGFVDDAIAPDASIVRATFILQDALGGASQRDWRYVDEVLAGYG